MPPAAKSASLSADSFENDDAPAKASTVTADGAARTHSFNKPGDVDWVKFTAKGGTTYDLKTADLGPLADTYLYLYGTDGTTLLGANDDDAGTLASAIRWKAPADGTYYAAVKHWNPTAAGCGTTYNLIIAGADTTPPGKPVLVSPANYAQVNRGALAFVWNKVDTTNLYSIHVDDNADFSSLIVNSTTSAASFTSPSLPNGKYYWRVRATRCLWQLGRLERQLELQSRGCSNHSNKRYLPSVCEKQIATARKSH